MTKAIDPDKRYCRLLPFIDESAEFVYAESRDIPVDSMLVWCKAKQAAARELGATGAVNAFKRALARLNRYRVNKELSHLTLKEWDALSKGSGVVEYPDLMAAVAGAE